MKRTTSRWLGETETALTKNLLHAQGPTICIPNKKKQTKTKQKQNKKHQKYILTELLLKEQGICTSYQAPYPSSSASLKRGKPPKCLALKTNGNWDVSRGNVGLSGMMIPLLKGLCRGSLSQCKKAAV